MGFLFLFLLGQSLTKLPFIDAGEVYKPPKWVLPLFATSSLFGTSLALSFIFFLLVTPLRSSDTIFLNQYQVQRSLVPPPSHGPLRAAEIILEEYDGDSNLDIFVNGYIVFSSERDCMMNYQCTNNSESIDFSGTYAEVPKYGYLHHLGKLSPTPNSISIEERILPGFNSIDVVSVNSGVGDCRVTLSINLRFESGEVVRSVRILPESGIAQEAQAMNLHSIDIFPSYGRSGGERLIEPYLTYNANVSYMLCQRIRYQFTLD